MALLLLAWCIFLGNPLATLSLLLFFGYITRFQIAPEERALLEKFGGPYAAYLSEVQALALRTDHSFQPTSLRDPA